MYVPFVIRFHIFECDIFKIGTDVMIHIQTSDELPPTIIYFSGQLLFEI